MDLQALELSIEGHRVEVSCLRRTGHRTPLVCLHGFGSTKEDYADLALHPAYAERDLVFFDAPGFGASTVEAPDALSIPFLVAVAVAVCDALGIEQFHLSGHSMGGLTALLLASQCHGRVLSFIDIEGNVAPEDCFLSRQIIEHPSDSPEAFLRGFIDRVRARPEYSSNLYAASLPLKVQETSVRPIFESMVALSDHTPLMEIMAALELPRVFVYGAQNRTLSYLPELPEIGVETVEIPFSGHFPMYSNPPVLWQAMADFIDRAEASL
ncbi:MAG: alpha/beta hydrolase [Pseudomonadota bacterium]